MIWCGAPPAKAVVERHCDNVCVCGVIPIGEPSTKTEIAGEAVIVNTDAVAPAGVVVVWQAFCVTMPVGIAVGEGTGVGVAVAVGTGPGLEPPPPPPQAASTVAEASAKAKRSTVVRLACSIS